MSMPDDISEAIRIAHGAMYGAVTDLGYRTESEATVDAQMPALAALAASRRWVAWQTQDRRGKPSKVPHAPSGGLAKANDPTTWGTRPQAETRMAALPRSYGVGGVGIMLGDQLGLAIGGIDLD